MKTKRVFTGTAAAVLCALCALAVSYSWAFEWRCEQNAVWRTGEKLDFSVRWQFITVGYATMQIRNIDDLNGRKAYHIFTEARSAPFFDNFYRVRDINESWIDSESLCSLKFLSTVNESKHNKTETLLLDQEKHEYKLVESNKTGTIPPWVQDVLSALYYVRTKELAVGQSYVMDAHQGDQSWPLVIKVVRREKIKVPAGEFETWVLEPSVRPGAGIFQSQGKLWVWLMADRRKAPVRLKAKIPIGSVDVVLMGMKFAD
jgi:hypothetical protein